MKLGFSTGALYPEYTVSQALDIFARQKIVSVEMGIDILDQIDELDSELLRSFKRVSLHAPKFPYSKDATTHDLFGSIKRIHAIRPLDLVIFHPDTVLDFDAFQSLPFPIGFENMDKNKASHKTVTELKAILDMNLDWKLVLDVNHIFTNDPSMESVKPFYELLDNRIAEIHLSGYSTLHDPLFETKQKEIVEAVQNWNIPVIIESQLRDPKNLARERAYIESIITRS